MVQWAKPSRTTVGAPRSLISQREYRGISILLTGTQGFESPYWLTYRQGRELGACSAWGARNADNLFHKRKGKTEESGVERDIPVARHYSAFNVAQVDGLNLRHELLYPAVPACAADPIGESEAIVSKYTSSPEIESGFARAAYNPGSDHVMNAEARELCTNGRVLFDAHSRADAFDGTRKASEPR